MDRLEIEQKVKEIVALQFHMTMDEITMSSHFVQDLLADSLDVVELVMAFEDRFDISVEDDRLDDILTVQGAVDVLVKELE